MGNSYNQERESRDLRRDNFQVENTRDPRKRSIERQVVQQDGVSGEDAEQATQLYPAEQVRAAVPTQSEEHRSRKEQADFHFDQQPKTVIESVVGGVVSAMKEIGRVTGHTPTRQHASDEVVEEITHKNWTQTETEL